MQIDKKCLLLLTDLNMGGVTTAAVNFANGLYERGAQVDVLVMDKASEGTAVGFAEGIRTLPMPKEIRLWNLTAKTVQAEKNPVKKAGYMCLGAVKKLINKKWHWHELIFRKKKYFSGYDVVIAFRQCSPCYGFALNNVEAEKKVAFVHGDLAFMGDISTWQPLMPAFDAVAYVSDGVKKGFVAQYPELEKNAITVYNTFLTEEILQKAQMPCEVDFAADRLNLITISRVENAVKGTGRIAPICQKLKDKYGDRFHWYVVGGGPDLAACKKQAEELGVTDHLTYLGAQKNPFRFMSRADICVFPTFTEAFPMVVGESLIVGIPVVATQYPAVTEIIVDGENGLIAEQSIESIFEKLTKLFDDRDLLLKIKQNCERYQYDNDRSYAQFCNAIEK